jgi:hypothetical protein
VPGEPRRIYVETRDLIFRSKVRAIIAGAGDQVTADSGACDLAVIELDPASKLDSLRALLERGTPVLAFGAHVLADLLRQARELGAEAVPNSAVETRLRALLTS